jgi:anti-anti-sigma factor
MFVVELRELPLDVHRRANAHNLILQRELALVHAADELGSAPARLLWLSRELRQRYAAFGDEARSTLQTALSADAAHIDLRYDVPADVAQAAVELNAALDEVDEFCRAGELLTLVASSEANAYRRWFLGEFIAQIRDGAGPTPWSQAMAGHLGVSGTGAVDRAAGPPGGPGPVGTVVVDEDLDLEGAARIRGELAAILDSGVLRLTVDLAACAFIDSVGISLLLTTRERLQDSGGAIIVVNANGQPRRTLETTGVYDVLVEGV